MTEAFDPNPNVFAVVRVKDGQTFANSRDVAAFFHKEHKNVLQKYYGLDCSEDFNRLNFQPVEYIDEKGETRRSVDMTRDGFVFIAFGFTGKRAAKFKEDYIAAFNQMEEKIARRAQIQSGPAQGSLALALDTNDSLSNIERHLHSISTGLGAKIDTVTGAIIGSIIKHIGRPILSRLEENQRWNEMRFQAIHQRDKLLIESLAAKHDAEECVSIYVAQTMMGVPTKHRSPRLSQNLSANAIRWFASHGFTHRPDRAHAAGPWVFQKAKIHQWWDEAGKEIFERAKNTRSASVIPFDRRGSSS
ncbi:Rha family transcriptional regulator [Aureimonas fodinaquatilis]|uniref:Rha family transcriptional regulator n=1 Tax=Aureimonas fodinaquatilis TaxID=2565783 RepID=A0A5B0DVI1_9HYPH|nr:Rha family transcriptional regulator [Aureimonas fodinaquatilis]KAA0970837.1 Rha family transcriptional regulator [Aureimonas fodinaquatilis]